MGLEAYRYGKSRLQYEVDVIMTVIQVSCSDRPFGLSLACNVKWIGLRGDDLNLIPQESLVPLKPKDSQIAKSLLSSKILQVD